jgi:hypothetical protein
MYTYTYIYLPVLQVVDILQCEFSVFCKFIHAEIVRPYDDDDVYFKKITTRVSQNLIRQKNADQPKA